MNKEIRGGGGENRNRLRKGLSVEICYAFDTRETKTLDLGVRITALRIAAASVVVGLGSRLRQTTPTYSPRLLVSTIYVTKK